MASGVKPADHFSQDALVGTTTGDGIGSVTPLSNGNYVVWSSNWNNGGVQSAGAVTWGNGTTGIVGPVSAANSLVGSQTYDQVGGAWALSNGNYVVPSLAWDNGAAVDVGAATWGNGSTGIVGPVSAANSLVGTTDGDWVGDVTALSNGNYVVYSPDWDNGAAVDVGAATWGNGSTGIVGPVSAANSLVGTTGRDWLGGVTALSNGNYVVHSPDWDNGSAPDAGAVTWGSGTTGIVGPVSAANSLVGSTAGDRVGCPGDYCDYGVTAIGNGNYVVFSSHWDNGGAADAGAVTWGSGISGTAGPVTAENSVLGTAAGGGNSMVWAYDYANRQLVVGRPADNIVTLFRPDLPVYLVFLPLMVRN